MRNHSAKITYCALAAFILSAALPPAFGANAQYTQTNLVSSVALPAVQFDPTLINPWGIAAGPTSPMWVSDNGTGLSTLYNGAGIKQGLIVSIPPDANSSPTGIIFNPVTADFPVTIGNAAFIFATENGAIAAWGGSLGTNAVVTATTAGAVYKGLAYENTGVAGNHIYAANFASGHIDVFDSTFTNVTSSTFAGRFTDPNLPSGFAPFNIQNLNGKLFVTYAATSGGRDETDGAGLGIVDVYDTAGNLLQRLINNGGALDAPWGLALAPSNFGGFSNDLLVGNFGDGTIHAYDPATGALVGTVDDPLGNPLTIDGLWGLRFGNGSATAPTNSLYFTAGPDGEQEGLLGTLTVPEPTSLALLTLAALSLTTRRRAIK